jgi:hypothetical protein
MCSTVPAIYSPRYKSPYVPLSGRLLAIGLALGSLAVLVIASQLTPSPSGAGTHTALGLQRCQFLVNTGIPCMSCGMTTSFAHFAHGQFLASLYVQPFGTVLAILNCTLFWSAAYIAVTGRAAHRIFRFVHTPPLLWTLLAFALCAWAWKILIHVKASGGG